MPEHPHTSLPDDGVAVDPREYRVLEQLLALESSEVDLVLDQASDILARELASDKVDVFLYRPEIDTLVALGTSHTDMGRHQKAAGLDRFPVSNGGRLVDVFKTSTPYLTGAADRDEGLSLGVRNVLGVRSMLAVPLSVAGETRGVLAVTSDQPDYYTEQDVAFASRLTGWLGNMVSNAELSEQRRQQLLNEARRATAEQLVNVLSHDLGNRLTPAMGRLDLLRRYARQAGNDKIISAADAARKSLDSIHSLIKDLLDVSRLDRGLFVLSPTQVNMVALAQEIADLFTARGANIKCRFPDEMWLTADAQRIRQAIENLLSNAIQHGVHGSPIYLDLDYSTRDDVDYVSVSVRDEGPGIAPDYMSSLFAPFAPGPGSPGLGIGLYLAHSIVRSHGGTLTADSTSSSGTTFLMLLPISAQSTDFD